MCIFNVPITVKGDQITVKGDQITVKGDQITVKGDQIKGGGGVEGVCTVSPGAIIST